MGTVAAAPASTVAPSVVHIAGPPVTHPTAYQYPLSQPTVATLRSLAKRLSLRRGPRRPFARLDQHEADVQEERARDSNVSGLPRAGSTWTTVRKWWPARRGRAGAGQPVGQVPLIRVSVPQDSPATARRGDNGDEDDRGLDQDDPVLFDAASAVRSSLDSYDLIEPASRSSVSQHRSGTLEDSSARLSSGDEEEEQEAQRAYEERRRRRRLRRGVS